MKRPAIRPIALAALWVLPLASAAETYGVLDAPKSRLDFEYRQMGVAVSGGFRRFDAEIRYDPAHPQAASAVVEVPVSAIDTGSPEGDQEAQGKDWFNAAGYPLARFESSSVKVLGPGRITLSGTLSIKGKRRAITVPVSVAVRPGQASFDGSFGLKRTDFGIGAGLWSDDEVVAHEVEVSFHLVTRPLPR